jgi:hypothetical protein
MRTCRWVWRRACAWPWTAPPAPSRTDRASNRYRGTVISIIIRRRRRSISISTSIIIIDDIIIIITHPGPRISGHLTACVPACQVLASAFPSSDCELVTVEMPGHGVLIGGTSPTHILQHLRALEPVRGGTTPPPPKENHDDKPWQRRE